MWGAGLKMRGKTANPSQGLDPHVKQGASQFLEKKRIKNEKNYALGYSPARSNKTIRGVSPARNAELSQRERNRVYVVYVTSTKYGTAAHVPSDQTCLIYPNMLSVRNNFIGGIEIYKKIDTYI